MLTIPKQTFFHHCPHKTCHITVLAWLSSSPGKKLNSLNRFIISIFHFLRRRSASISIRRINSDLSRCQTHKQIRLLFSS